MADFKLKKEQKLLSPSDFSYLRKNSTIVSTKWFRAYFKETQKKSSNSRIGLSVSKKVGNAVHRNIVKRQLREVYRHSTLRSNGIDFLIVVSPKMKTGLLKEKNAKSLIQKEFSHLIEKIITKKRALL